MWSNTGLLLVGFYAALALACQISAMLYTADGVGGWILMRLPIEPTILVLDALGHKDMIGNMPWGRAYALLLPPILAVLYACGWIMGACARWLAKTSV